MRLCSGDMLLARKRYVLLHVVKTIIAISSELVKKFIHRCKRLTATCGDGECRSCTSTADSVDTVDVESRVFCSLFFDNEIGIMPPTLLTKGYIRSKLSSYGKLRK